jgi:hypothetical protein
MDYNLSCIIKSALTSALIVVSSQVCGQIYAANYSEVRGNEIIDRYLTGMGLGFFTANTKLVALGQKPLYCPPPTLGLSGRNYIDILEKELERAAKNPKEKAFFATTPVEFYMMAGLISTFPCK